MSNTLPARALALALAFAATAVLAIGNDAAKSRHPDWEPGLEAIRAKDWSTAIDHLKAVVRIEPDNADAHNWLAYACRNRRPQRGVDRGGTLTDTSRHRAFVATRGQPLPLA